MLILLLFYVVTSLSIWHLRSHVHPPAHAPIVWCMQKMACSISLYDTQCLEYWKGKLKERIKTSNLIVDHFPLIFVTLLLIWILYFHVWLQNKGKFLVWSKYYNQFGIYQLGGISIRIKEENLELCQTSKMEG